MLGLSPKDGSRMNDEEREKKAKHIVGLMNVNQQMLDLIESVGAKANLLPARMKALMSFLVEQGILTVDQQLEEAESWELVLRTELQPAYEQVKRAIEMSGAPRQTEGGLIVPGMNAPRNVRG